MKRHVILAFSLLVVSSAETETRNQEFNAAEQQVERVVNSVFAALRSRDTARWRELLHPDGRWFVQSVNADGVAQLVTDTTPARIAALGMSDAEILETNFDPEIRVDGDIATYWARYVAQLADGTVIACGQNAFQLVKTSGHWRVANILFSQSADCPAL